MQQTAPLGRPRNDLADIKILQSALRLYGEAGWHGFNFTKIAAKAGVGKSSMYARWTEREELLIDAFRALVVSPGPVGEDPRTILINEIEYRLREYLGPHRGAVRRVFVEMCSSSIPVITEAYEHVYVRPIKEINVRLWDFKKAGIIPGHISVTRLLDAIEGSVLMRTFCLPEEDVECFLTEVEEYAELLVDDQLRGINTTSMRIVHVS
ncbi:MAG: TetR/AcrR family transcriptional regulator [Brooklawnia sp.]|nr:TetR/AcrR family transcriptional regulator [Brooklawnia sp.]